MSTTDIDLLQEFENPISLKPAARIFRFLNYFIDVVAMYVIASVLGILFAFVAIGVRDGDDPSPDTARMLQILLLLAWIPIIFGYYTLFEYFGKGRTLGKMVTGTVAVREDGSRLTFKDALLRTLCRFIPFEFISAFGFIAWHDSLTRTLVIKKVK